MCGIFGSFGKKSNYLNRQLIKLSERRGRDSSGIAYLDDFNNYNILRADSKVTKLAKSIKNIRSQFFLGHSRLITNSMVDNQPIIKDDIVVVHNGIVLNGTELSDKFNYSPSSSIDTATIVDLLLCDSFKLLPIEERLEELLQNIKGSFSCAILFGSIGKLALISNTGSLFFGEINGETLFASERFILENIGIRNVQNLRFSYKLFDVPSSSNIVESQVIKRNRDLIPNFKHNTNEEELLIYEEKNLKRCTKCILPSSMPFISFNKEGVCNYCDNYKIRNRPKPISDLKKLLDGVRKFDGADCIMPFSGGRDSSFALHLAVKELDMRPVTYTYDWGMVTDLARRNISLMCAELKVENIIVAADLELKRKNIRKNLVAWLEHPHLGLISLLTAGDKHFFRYVKKLKQETGIEADVWGVSPLEVTHFKSGFLGVKPNFLNKKVYNNGFRSQLSYHFKRFNAMKGSIKFFNSSLWDTLSGEYYRSLAPKSSYYHLFDYWKWDEKEIDYTLQDYGWEKAVDTNTTWRIGDGTAAFYNYVYHLLVGFTEHDTFRSNQIREGNLSRAEAIELVKDENQPRYQNIKWYLDTLELDFVDVISRINKIPRESVVGT